MVAWRQYWKINAGKVAHTHYYSALCFWYMSCLHCFMLFKMQLHNNDVDNFGSVIKRGIVKCWGYISKMSVNVLIFFRGGRASHAEFGIILEHVLLYFFLNPWCTLLSTYNVQGNSYILRPQIKLIFGLFLLSSAGREGVAMARWSNCTKIQYREL